MLDGIVPPLLVLLTTAALLGVRSRRCTVDASRARGGDAVALIAILLVTGGLELAMGRAPVYRPGPVRLWSGDINSDQNSQQVIDPYTFTHIVHGAAFYALTRMAFGPGAVISRAITAIGVEASWEVYENTDQVIDRYRAATIALGYYGDSILNSVFDIVACAVGFVLAWKLPTRATVAWVVLTEVALALAIRDNLALNIVMLIHPVDAIRRWQLGS